MPYYQFAGPDGPHGSFETFYADAGDWLEGDEHRPCQAGWYWHACFPGCMPDGDSFGPFATEQDAIEDAQDGQVVQMAEDTSPLCTYPQCKCIVSTSTSQPEPRCPIYG